MNKTVVLPLHQAQKLHSASRRTITDLRAAASCKATPPGVTIQQQNRLMQTHPSKCDKSKTKQPHAKTHLQM